MSLFQDLQQRRAKVLFVCLANSGRSQIAEALGREYASDVMDAQSAGIQPASQVSRRAVAVLAEKGIALDPMLAQKNILSLDLGSFDLVVNLCEYAIAAAIPSGTVLLNVPTPDPMGQGEDAYREVRDRQEKTIRFLGEHFRRAKEWTPYATPSMVSAAGVSRTKPAPPPAEVPQQGTASAAAV